MSFFVLVVSSMLQVLVTVKVWQDASLASIRAGEGSVRDTGPSPHHYHAPRPLPSHSLAQYWKLSYYISLAGKSVVILVISQPGKQSMILYCKYRLKFNIYDFESGT